jgi:probable phosphomutase (TIGR03848 family)
MALVFLVRHGLTDHTGTRLYGRSPGIHLSERGREQAEHLAERFAGVRLSAIYTSPLERCVETAEPLADAQRLDVVPRDGLVEMDAGRWTNRPLAGLARTKLWRAIQHTPSQTAFPDGEGFLAANARLAAELNAVAARHPKGRVAVVSHSDNIRMLLTHVAGAHLDHLQRMIVDTCSVSVVGIGDGLPRIFLANDTAGSLERFGGGRGARRGVYGK